LNQLADAIETGAPLPPGFTARRVRVPPVPAVTAADIKAIREALGASQPVFAGFLGLSSQTIKAWEQGVKVPPPPVRRMLADMRERPAHWRKVLRRAVAG
jgi:DNA-binding transcriptional regulator YiaG